jgi:lipid II isoglutaminyl synthase (glutamine-hydrolysing)
MRTHIAKHTGRFISHLSRTLKLGGGSAAPGLYALKIDPNLVENLAKNIPQNIVITGTNGKTTTARMLAHFLTEQGFKVIRNSTGSNLERGIASALIHGNLSKYDVGIWELDEAAFNKVAPKIKPQLIIFLNAFRDQLDRYGEVDQVVGNLWKTLAEATWQTTLLINGADVNTHGLVGINQLRAEKKLAEFEIYQFRVENHMIQGESSVFANEPNETADFGAKVIKNNGLKGSEIEISHPNGSLKLKFPIPGLYHVYDLLAAFGAAYLLNVNIENIEKLLKNFSPAFGRVEKITLNEKEAFIFLIKNPAGATAVFETLKPELTSQDRLLLALNDNFADGLDVSWIWDASFELLPHIIAICSGTRAPEIALRLKYAGFDPKLIVIENNLKMALEQAVEAKKGRIFILPTYTALLKLQAILAKQGAKQEYWREEIK